MAILKATTSPADAAYIAFTEARRVGGFPNRGIDRLNEADTRAKIIDPIFKDVLGWQESEIRREEPSAKGYADYVLGSDFSYILIEAKRTKPRFALNVPSKARRLNLDGPHLLKQKKLKPLMEQAQSYANDLGAQFALLTNGDQFIIFKPYLPGRPWKSGSAIVWHDWDDIDNHFAEFYNLLARDRVREGVLVQEFSVLDSPTRSVHTPISYLSDPDRELVRNPFWNRISRVIGPLLRDKPEDDTTQLEIIENCYVTTPLSSQADRALNALIRDEPQRFLVEAGVRDLKPGRGGATAFTHQLERDVTSQRAGTYILTGGVGSGKTTFLKRFARVVKPGFVREYCVWFHVDFLVFGNVPSDATEPELREFTYAAMRRTLATEWSSYASLSGEDIRGMFAEEIDAAEKTRLYGVPRASSEWNAGVNELVDTLYKDDVAFVSAALRRLKERGRRIIVVLDNTDQLGERFQEEVFLFAQRLSADHGALCIVALREEKFFAAYRRGIFDAFGDRQFHIGSPHLGKVIEKRLTYGRTRFQTLATQGKLDISTDDILRVDALLSVLIRSTTRRNANTVRMLASVAHGDMRHALDMFREFVSSGNTNIGKILTTVRTHGGYTVPFHEFAKSAILGSRKYYRSSVAHVVNLFKLTDARSPSHVASLRLLARLSAAQGAASPHGEGFVSVTSLLSEYRSSFGLADDLVQWSAELLRRNLIESEPPRAVDCEKADALRINAAGSYYLRYLVQSFAYVDLVYLDTPIADESLARKLAELSDSTDMRLRFKRVKLFLRYLAEQERQDLMASAERRGPYRDPLMTGIIEQMSNEMRVIRRKLRMPAIDEETDK